MTGYGDHDGVLIAIEGDLLRVRLTNPANRNAQTPATWRRLAEAASLATDQTRAIVVDADGPSFSAGLDRRMITPDGVPGEASILAVSAYDDAALDAFIRECQAGFSGWRTAPQLTIALVNGHAVGAGFQLALACDVMVVGDDAKLAMRETSLGLVPDLGGTGPLLDRVGYSRALEICVTGRFVEADEAVRLGIALAAVPQPEWDGFLDTFLAPVRAALPGAVSELKALLREADGGSGQRARERAGQARRLRELRAIMAGT